MLKKNKNYKDIAAAYMKLIKPRKPESTISGITSENTLSRPMSKVSEEKRSKTSLHPKAKLSNTK
jgi:hypothetical protein